MSVTSDIEEKLGIKIESLSPEEKQTYLTMLNAVKEAEMTPQKLKDYIAGMRDAVERELVVEPTFIRIFIFKVANPKLIKLQARLQNYMLLEAFLMSPERAKAQLEAMVTNLGGDIK